MKALKRLGAFALAVCGTLLVACETTPTTNEPTTPPAPLTAETLDLTTVNSWKMVQTIADEGSKCRADANYACIVRESVETFIYSKATSGNTTYDTYEYTIEEYTEAPEGENGDEGVKEVIMLKSVYKIVKSGEDYFYELNQSGDFNSVSYEMGAMRIEHEFDDGNELIKGKTACFYSNNLVVKEKDGKERMLVQYSENISISGECEKNCQPSQVNVMHLWIESV